MVSNGLAKVEKTIQERLKREAKGYNKSYPGELIQFDTKRLRLLKGQSTNESREYLFVTLMDMWHSQTCFKNRTDRRIRLLRFINLYNTVEPHKSLNNGTPYEILNSYFNQPLCK